LGKVLPFLVILDIGGKCGHDVASIVVTDSPKTLMLRLKSWFVNCFLKPCIWDQVLLRWGLSLFAVARDAQIVQLKVIEVPS